MSKYLEEIAAALVRVLDHAAELPAHRLVGYTANLDFWLAEVRHRLRTIDDYSTRFEQMKKAVKEYSKKELGGVIRRVHCSARRGKVSQRALFPTAKRWFG